jgi:hypothetical protein
MAVILCAGALSAAVGCAGSAESHAEIRVHRNVVNLISEEAALALHDFVETGAPGAPLTATRAFYQSFSDDYDFLFLVTDDGGTQPAAEGRAMAVHRPVIPGTGIDEPTDLDEYPRRLRAVLGVRGAVTFGLGVMGPWAHEMAHYWANFLDPSLGLTGVGNHFNAAVVGQLGVDASNRDYCANPEGEAPPNCIANARGRYELYQRRDDLVATPYAKLELYLMGLLPNADVEDGFFLARNATAAPNPKPDEYSTFFEVDGWDEIRFADVVARHGKRIQSPEEGRHFRAAFVTVTREAASPELLDSLADNVDIFGDLKPPRFAFFPSFARLASEHATLDVTLGPQIAAGHVQAEKRR